MDITKRLTLKVAGDPKADWADLALEAISHIEFLRKEIAGLRDEISGSFTPKKKG